MKLTNKQAMMLLDIVKDSVSIMGTMGGFSVENRLRLVNAILSQQSDELVDLEKVPSGVDDDNIRTD